MICEAPMENIVNDASLSFITSIYEDEEKVLLHKITF